MVRGLSIVMILATVVVCSTRVKAQQSDVTDKGKVCHLEQQCRWENFQKHCIWVKVCR